MAPLNLQSVIRGCIVESRGCFSLPRRRKCARATRQLSDSPEILGIYDGKMVDFEAAPPGGGKFNPLRDLGLLKYSLVVLRSPADAGSVVSRNEV